MEFGQRLKELRKQFDMTQEELAQALEMSKSNISKYERNELEPSLSTLVNISRLFKIDINSLLGIKVDVIDPRNDYKFEGTLNVSAIEATYERYIDQFAELQKTRLKDKSPIIKALYAVIIQNIEDLLNTSSVKELTEINKLTEEIWLKVISQRMDNNK
ncbi:helix-turn-helix domain-containing protein [Aneurinibacillus migulanus]|uniref:helix-turn-helix domain-containing protein n=1 Tax=Aneurinibacillus migulanus TaxID=47500 RepID=UPI0020A18A42|nr:helix-turn-helix transcriptional regulator [Aneurinibacillus migulanus]MCP1355424.1 helix-turn-helix domain-containing protein [Aneurinibacillus migulanus]